MDLNRKGIIKENPEFAVVLGLCPALAVTTQTIGGLVTGIAVIFVLVFSNLFIALFSNIIPNKIRILFYILITAVFVTVVRLLIQVFTPDLYSALGIYIPLIVVNCIILGKTEPKNPFNSVVDGLGKGIGFTLVLTLIGFIREVPGSGTLNLKLLGIGTVIDLHNYIRDPAIVMVMPAGGFIVMGLLLAFFQLIKNSRIIKKEQ